jgi:replicative DNA helicase
MNYPLNQTTTNEPPNNVEAEESLIGSCLIDGNTSVLDVVSPVLDPSDFFTARCQYMFSALLKLASKNKPLDEIHIVEELKSSGSLDEVGGVQGVMRMVDAATTELQAMHYANLIAEKSKLRKLIRQCKLAQEYALTGTKDFNDIRSELEGSVLDIDAKNSDGFSVQDSVRELMDDINLMKSGDFVPNVVRTNVGRLDLFLGNGGIAAGEVLTLAAPTSCGKSAFALYVALKAMIEQKVTVGYFSFEMPQKQIMKRMIQSISGVNVRNIQDGTADSSQADRFLKAASQAESLPLFTSHSVKSIEDLVGQARYLVRKKGAKLLVIDYLQLIGFNSKSMSKCEGIAHISHRIKQMALDLNVSVLLLAQVNREGAKRESGLSLYDLKDSGDIENDADAVLLMWPEKGDVESSKSKDDRGSYTSLFCKIAKNREGERDVLDSVKFYHCTGRFH